MLRVGGRWGLGKKGRLKGGLGASPALPILGMHPPPGDTRVWRNENRCSDCQDVKEGFLAFLVTMCLHSGSNLGLTN